MTVYIGMNPTRVTSHEVARISLFACLSLLSIVSSQVDGAVNVNIDHDLSEATYGLEGKTGSSIKYDQQNGLNLGGTVADLLGPPIKIANGFNSFVKGNNMATVGTGLKTGGALLGLDAKLFEAAGAGDIFKGNLLLNSLQRKHSSGGQTTAQTTAQMPTQQTTQQVAVDSTPIHMMLPTKGEKIANIVEIPVKVVAMKDLMGGKMMNGIGAIKGAGASHLTNKGQDMMSQAQALKMSGINQMIQGANEGVQNLGNMFQRTAGNMQTAIKLAPLVWDMQQQDSAKGGQQQQVVKEQRPTSMAYQAAAPTGGSLFGGLASLLPNFGAQGANPSYAAVLNATDPLMRLLTNQNMSPFLLPFTSGPLGQSVALKQPIGTEVASGNPVGGGGPNRGGLLTTGQGSQSFDFSLLPGVRYRETVSGTMPGFGRRTESSKTSQQQVQAEPQKQQQQHEAVASKKS